MDPLKFSLTCGWAGFLGGVLSGAVMGLLFHREDWLGGYGSRERRMVRLGHISFFGIGLINLFYALSLEPLEVPAAAADAGAFALLVALVTMPSICFLCAWRKPFRHLFFVPVLATVAGIGVILFARP
ncbi:MAG: hypothetical protein EAZ84_09225 [Verrucomicrobia bacterium]|nr:MAG: hypothetical protein EAZ84_09225 [Verrucomicrobiota bacterium]TAE85834.1 MAG: hypothetical protein EAZ82_12735 [Verrucomicrobiota bacterium]TAF23361.1 MAG: hypothetical protein EAZ71_12840 [Verrucomicrobiota bacterium]